MYLCENHVLMFNETLVKHAFETIRYPGLKYTFGQAISYDFDMRVVTRRKREEC